LHRSAGGRGKEERSFNEQRFRQSACAVVRTCAGRGAEHENRARHQLRHGHDPRGRGVLSFFNAVLKPLLLLFTLPFIVLSLGIGIWIINAILFYFVGRLVDGFYVAGFGSALLGALIVSLTNLLMNRLLARPRRHGPPPAARRDDVIDI